MAGVTGYEYMPMWGMRPMASSARTIRSRAATGSNSMNAIVRRLAVAAALAVSLASSLHGQEAAEFYKNKQLRLIVGHEVSNDYDVGARLLARYLQKRIPGQQPIIVQNMVAAASIAAANYISERAPRDGTVIGSFSRNLPSQAMMGQANVEADPRRFNWLGATSLPGRICVAWHSAPVKTAADLLTQELIVGGSGAGSSLSILPTVFNHVLGTKFRVIEGYKGTQDTMLAVERGEVQGVCATSGQFRNYDRLFRDGKLRILFHAEEGAMPDLPGVPSIFELAKTTEQRQFMRFVFSSVEFGRPYVFPPDVPKDRVAWMRRAVAEAAQDPELLAEAEKSKLDMTYRAPEHLGGLVHDLYETPAKRDRSREAADPQHAIGGAGNALGALVPASGVGYIAADRRGLAPLRATERWLSG
jgi:tripartite-type tricarboxylate transporter receptor subunit TctC